LVDIFTRYRGVEFVILRSEEAGTFQGSEIDLLKERYFVKYIVVR